MELKEFITNTLSDIMEGVANAQQKINNYRAIVIPDERRTFLIEFEVELSELDSKENGGGVGVYFANIGIGAKQKECESGNSRTSIKFSIPIGYPENKRQ